MKVTPIPQILAALTFIVAPHSARAQAQSGHTADIYIKPPELIYRGYISPNGVKAIEADILRHPDIKILRITSGGGDADQAIELTDFIRVHNIKVVVEDYCMSACAHMLFAGSPTHSVSPGAIVGFHHTEVVFSDVRRIRGPKESALGAAHVARLEDAYRRWGLNPTLLTAPFANMGLLCLTIEPGPEHEVRYWTSAAYWVPSEAQLVLYGVSEPVGSWPKAASDAESGLTALRRDHTNLVRHLVRFGGTPPSIISVIKESHDCPADGSPPAETRVNGDTHFFPPLPPADGDPRPTVLTNENKEGTVAAP